MNYTLKFPSQSDLEVIVVEAFMVSFCYGTFILLKNLAVTRECSHFDHVFNSLGLVSACTLSSVFYGNVLEIFPTLLCGSGTYILLLSEKRKESHINFQSSKIIYKLKSICKMDPHRKQKSNANASSLIQKYD